MFALIAWCSLVPPLPMLLLSALWREASLPAAVAGASWASLGVALFLGATTSAYAIWGRLLGRYPAAIVAPLALLSPVTGVVVSALVFGERFTSLRYAGMALIVAGLAVIVLQVPDRTVTPPVPRMERYLPGKSRETGARPSRLIFALLHRGSLNARQHTARPGCMDHDEGGARVSKPAVEQCRNFFARADIAEIIETLIGLVVGTQRH